MKRKSIIFGTPNLPGLREDKDSIRCEGTRGRSIPCITLAPTSRELPEFYDAG
jgi:hypothetical protein